MIAALEHASGVSAGANAPSVDRDALDQRIDYLNRLMRTHAGAIELVDVTERGAVTVRFVAMCQGCPFRAVTMFGLVVPALENIEGVTQVTALGVRISEEAARRAADAIGGDSAWPIMQLKEDSCSR